MRADVAVVGAGIIGALAAYELAKRGVAVALLDAEKEGAATLASAGMLAPYPEGLSGELLEAGLPGDTPVLYGHKVAQPGEEVGLTDLKGLAHLPARDTTVYLVGEALRAKGVRSLLYDPSFKHRYRR